MKKKTESATKTSRHETRERDGKQGKLSDAMIVGMLGDMKKIQAAKWEALAEYEIAIRTTEDVQAQLVKLHLFDRAAQRVAKSEIVWRRAKARQPEDFERLIAQPKTVK